MVSDFVYLDELANAQQPQSIDSSVIEYVATGVMSLELFHRELSWGDFANSTELQETTDDFVLPQETTTSSEEELLFPDDGDVIEYINELTQEAIEEQERGEKFYSLEELQREILGI